MCIWTRKDFKGANSYVGPLDENFLRDQPVAGTGVDDSRSIWEQSRDVTTEHIRPPLVDIRLVQPRKRSPRNGQSTLHFFSSRG